MTDVIEKAVAAYKSVHMARTSPIQWQASLRKDSSGGWLIGFGATIQSAIIDAATGQGAKRIPQYDPGPPVFQEDPLS